MRDLSVNHWSLEGKHWLSPADGKVSLKYSGPLGKVILVVNGMRNVATLHLMFRGAGCW